MFRSLYTLPKHTRYLNAGERAVILVLARDRDQAKIVFNYVTGLLRAIAPLYQMIEAERADKIELNNGVTVIVKTSDYRAIRGLTVAACIADEIAFWDSGGYRLTVKCSLPCVLRCQ